MGQKIQYLYCLMWVSASHTLNVVSTSSLLCKHVLVRIWTAVKPVKQRLFSLLLTTSTIVYNGRTLVVFGTFHGMDMIAAPVLRPGHVDKVSTSASFKKYVKTAEQSKNKTVVIAPCFSNMVLDCLI
jgi:hypothetical protein